MVSCSLAAEGVIFAVISVLVTGDAVVAVVRIVVVVSIVNACVVAVD